MPNDISTVLKRLPAVMLAVFVLSGCARVKSGDDKVIAYVNKDPIYESDLRREIALRAKFDPEFKLAPETAPEQLDAMIDRKVMVQAAMEKGLAREDKFVDTIRTIWEHTLIRDFVEFKKKEYADYLFATDEEIKKYYGDMSSDATFRVFRSRDKSIADQAYDKFQKDGDASGWQQIGPVAYEDLGSIALVDAFDLEAGKAGKFSDDTEHYVILLEKKDKKEMPPMEEMKADIEKRVIVMKERRLFDDWLKERKKKARITIKAVPE